MTLVFPFRKRLGGRASILYVEVFKKKSQSIKGTLIDISRSKGEITDSKKETNEKAVATGHTHGAYDEEMGLGNDVFSGLLELRGKNDREARKKINDKGKDIGSSNDAALQDYLVTPSGTLQHYDPSTGKIRIVNTEMPKDASDKNKIDDIKQYYGQK